MERPLPDDRVRPLTDRLPKDPAARSRIIAVHSGAVAAARDTYLDPTTGFVVFTALGLWRNGRCCRSGCRHCPYEGGLRYDPDEAG